MGHSGLIKAGGILLCGGCEIKTLNFLLKVFPLVLLFFSPVIFTGGITSAVGEEPAVFTFKSVTVEPDIVKAGEDFKITARFNTGEGEEAAGYVIAAYEVNVPRACRNTDWILNEKANPRWNSYTIMPWRWFGRKSGEDITVTHVMSTKNLPLGDYNFDLRICVFIDGKDFYRNTGFLVSIIE